jgi:predicted RNA polymerase sigma factor
VVWCRCPERARGLDVTAEGRRTGAQRGMAGDHRLPAVRAHLLEMAGDLEAAVDCYRAAAEVTASLPQQRYLHARAARLADGLADGTPR